MTKHSIPKQRAPRWVLVCLACVTFAAVVLPGALAPASVEEQRQLLPPPAKECSDPVTGQWMGHQILRNQWYRFTLNVERVSPGSEELTGHIDAHIWDGGPEQSQPPPCEGGRNLEYMIEMPAEGEFRNNRISFIGQSYKITKRLCGNKFGAYYPDGFSGALIEEGTEFHSINDDGHNPEIPVVFLRIKCEENVLPTPDLPEDAPPPKYSKGCGCL